jgi:hypothetical protein
MAELAIALRERRVGGVAHQRVSEGEGFGAREARLAAREQELVFDELRQRFGELALVPGSTEQLQQPRTPEGLAEDAGGAQHATRLLGQRVQARLHHRQHGVRQVGAPARHGADQLLEIKRVALRSQRHLTHHLGRDRLAEHAAHQALARLVREGGQSELLDAGSRPELGKGLGDARARQREHHERTIRELRERAAHELDARPVAPLQIVQHEQHRPLLALCGDEVAPCALDLTAHQRRVAARALQLLARLLAEAHAAHLTEEFRAALRFC